MFNKEVIEHLLLKKGWTKYRLAKEANLGQSTVHEIMSGKKKSPNSLTLQKLANALDVSVDAFFDESEFIPDKKISNITNADSDSDIIRIERARKKMPEKEKEKMMKVLEAAFEKYFDD